VNSEAREDRPQLVEIHAVGFDRRGVSGVQAPVCQADEGLGGQPQLGQALVAVVGHERDRVARPPFVIAPYRRSDPGYAGRPAEDRSNAGQRSGASV
jgi:hypothetical protein